MQGSTFHSVADVEEFRHLIRPSDTEFLVTGKGSFQATVTKIDLVSLGLQSLTENLPRTWHLAISAPKVGIAFSAVPGPPMAYRGAELADNDVCLVRVGMDVWHRLSGESHLGSMSLPEDVVAQQSLALVGRDLTPPRHHCSAQIPSPLISRLRRLHRNVVHLAQTAPEIVANPHAAKALEAPLVETFIDCLSAGRLQEDLAAQRRHHQIVKRLYELAREHAGEPLYLAEVCKALGVSKRTLHYSCWEQLGIGPKQYLVLRRLHLAHQALLRASPSGSSITEIAMRFGFWELGRFAVTYRTVFGETPSATLRASGR